MDLLRFEPLLRPMLWGGERIVRYKGLTSDVRGVGESWELSSMPGHETAVAEGPYAGRTLTELIAEYGGDLVGKSNYARFGNRFPLLVKFIDAERDLSIQVHPGDELAARRHAQNGKTEMWYVVHAEPGAQLMAGFVRPVTPAEFDRRVEERTLTEVLRRYDVHAGDLYFLPAGCIHNIGAGVFTVEIQQASDLTYRIWDFGRRDSSGRCRELHTAQARDAIDFDRIGESRVPYRVTTDREVPLLACPYFRTSLWEFTHEGVCDFSATDSFVVLIFIGGGGSVEAGRCRMRVRQGETLLVPATTDRVRVIPDGGSLKFLTAAVD